jgi:hypothetical protein
MTKEQPTTPIFEIGKVPCLSHCEIQIREHRSDGWYYFVRNNYNPWGSGWVSENQIINEIYKQDNP